MADTYAHSFGGVSEFGVIVTKRPKKRRDQVQKHIPVVVTRDWTVSEIISQYPQTTEIMAEWGLHCFACSVSAIESIAEGCLGHGFTEEDIELLIGDINDAIAHTPPRPQELSLTLEAAQGIYDIAKREGSACMGLSVQAEKDGTMYLEFRDAMEEGEKEFLHPEVPEVRIWASLLTLQRIGGSRIMFKDGKFSLEIVEGCCVQNGKKLEKWEKCGCANPPPLH